MAKAKGYYSKASRHARAMAKCSTCEAKANAILAKKYTRKAGGGGARAPRKKKVPANKKILFDDAGNPIIVKKKYVRKPKTPVERPKGYYKQRALMKLAQARMQAKGIDTPSMNDMRAPW